MAESTTAMAQLGRRVLRHCARQISIGTTPTESGRGGVERVQMMRTPDLGSKGRSTWSGWRSRPRPRTTSTVRGWCGGIHSPNSPAAEAPASRPPTRAARTTFRDADGRAYTPSRIRRIRPPRVARAARARDTPSSRRRVTLATPPTEWRTCSMVPTKRTVPGFGHIAACASVFRGETGSRGGTEGGLPPAESACLWRHAGTRRRRSSLGVRREAARASARRVGARRRPVRG